ncbi:high affinity immunoglobulin gamma Fc receptor I isoform X1 [Esox lucius]|uniref:Ig-like domain-containing protein n=1 Tax=Esox lucius TaxID=8010 RepID=A0A6Q2YL53_ESOLU|nr:high affinity immunoglobulin gamma Fc receptor I isoform X1 [Esox lucius]
MEITCLLLMMFSPLIYFSLGQRSASLLISPDRSQFFEYESVSLRCEIKGNSTEWTLKRYTSTGKHLGSVINYKIETAKTSDSGEYWCESTSGEQSNTVNITVHGGHVILESPALPVTERHSVTLRCRLKTTSNITADFYKDGSFIKTESTGELTIPAVSGFYKCIIPMKGESPVSKMITTDDTPTTLIVHPNRSQFFEYESVSLNCKIQGNSTGWRLKRYKSTGKISESAVDRGFNHGSSYEVTTTKTSDSGVYRCDSGSGEHSNAVNITVHDGAVILESPTLPLTKGHSVTLNCRYKKTPSDLTADFYKDGSLIRTGSTGEMAIPAVSQSDEGWYWCQHRELGESPQSFMNVTGSTPDPSPSISPIPEVSMSLSRLLCSLLVVSPYLVVTTVLMVKCYRTENSGQRQLGVSGSGGSEACSSAQVLLQ